MKKGDNKANWLMIILVLLGFLIVGLVLSILIVNLNKDTNVEEQASTEAAMMSGDATNDQISQYIKDVEKQINETSDSETKARLYDMRAAYLRNYVDLGNTTSADDWLINQMKSDVYKAEEIYPTASTAINIAYYENSFGDKELAESYHQKAIERGWSSDFGDG